MSKHKLLNLPVFQFINSLNTHNTFVSPGSCIPNGNINNKKKSPWASPVAQWLRIRLPMQGTRVRALVWEDPTCHGATKPVRHNY